MELTEACRRFPKDGEDICRFVQGKARRGLPVDVLSRALRSLLAKEDAHHPVAYLDRALQRKEDEAKMVSQQYLATKKAGEKAGEKFKRNLAQWQLEAEQGRRNVKGLVQMVTDRMQPTPVGGHLE